MKRFVGGSTNAERPYVPDVLFESSRRMGREDDRVVNSRTSSCRLRHTSVSWSSPQAATHEHPRRTDLVPFHVYILASKRHGTLYVGITNDLRERMQQHRAGLGSKFVKRYKIHRLVYVEPYDDPESAIRREKQLKKWNRDWKIRLIEEDNLEWRDLSDLIT